MRRRPQSLRESLPGLIRTVRYLWPYIRKQRALNITALLALLASVALRLLEPWPMKFIFDHVIIKGTSGLQWIDSLNPIVVLACAALAVIAITGLRALADYWNGVGLSLMGTRVLAEVRSELYRHLHYLSLSFHNRARSGDLISRVMSDVSMLRDVAVSAFLPLVANLVILFSMIGLMCWFHWELALFALIPLPLFWFSTLRLTRRIREVSRKQRQREGAMAAAAAESITAIKVIQALSLQRAFVQAFSDRNQQSQKQDLKGSRLSATLERRAEVLLAVSVALVLWRGARLVLGGALTPGDLLVFITYVKKVYHPVQDFAKYAARLAKASAAGERVVDLLAREPEVRDLPGAVSAPVFRGDVRFKRVSFEYEPGHSVLQQIDFEAPAGHKIALVGPSGHGKSTLTSLLLRLYDPSEGRVLIDGHDIRDYTVESLRSRISVVLQENLLFAATVRDNIAYGLPDATPAEIEAAAQLANAHGFVSAMPQGYDTLVGERGLTLSNGQRQRIAIARAAIRKAPILILDEPTTALDEENERVVLSALERLAKGRTTFLITHSLRLAADADLILYLEDGHLVERGTPAELMQANGRYAHLYRLQSGFHEVRAHGTESHAFVS
jgi:ATP-binding cassette subfamily B protein